MPNPGTEGAADKRSNSKQMVEPRTEPGECDQAIDSGLRLTRKTSRSQTAQQATHKLNSSRPLTEAPRLPSAFLSALKHMRTSTLASLINRLARFTSALDLVSSLQCLDLNSLLDPLDPEGSGLMRSETRTAQTRCPGLELVYEQRLGRCTCPRPLR